MSGASLEVGTAAAPRHSTLLALVWELGDEIESPEALAREAGDLVNSGRVVLTGNFRGCRLELPRSADA